MPFTCTRKKTEATLLHNLSGVPTHFIILHKGVPRGNAHPGYPKGIAPVEVLQGGKTVIHLNIFALCIQHRALLIHRFAKRLPVGFAQQQIPGIRWQRDTRWQRGIGCV